MSDLERRFEQVIRNEISRRRLLRRGAAGALSLSAFSYLAACGSETSHNPTPRRRYARRLQS